MSTKKNCVFRGTAPPEDVVQHPIHSKKCTAWVAIFKDGIVGPFRFEDENEPSLTVNSARYLEVMKKY